MNDNIKLYIFIVLSIAVLIAAGNSKIRLIEMVGLDLDSETATILTTADQYYKISGTFTDGLDKGFTISESGTITYNCAGGMFLLNGTSDLKANKTCEITYALFLNGANTGKITPFTHMPNLEIDPAISPDGKFIAYAAGTVGNMDIFVRQLSGGTPIVLTKDLAGYNRWPRWSPDGTTIAAPGAKIQRSLRLE